MAKVLQVCNGLNNVGDRLASIITERIFNIEVVPVFRNLSKEHEGRQVLAGLGSFLGYCGNWPLHVWGTGFEPGYVSRDVRMNPGSRNKWVFHAVRGKVTRTYFKLAKTCPVGDPALLLPRFYNPPGEFQVDTRYFLHCNNEQAPPLSTGISVESTAIDPFYAINLITSSNFVFTEALHIAILAHAYGIPWAWSLNKHTQGMVKWFDWFSSIDVNPAPFWYAQITEARRWAEKTAKISRSVNLNLLVDSFPHSICF